MAKIYIAKISFVEDDKNPDMFEDPEVTQFEYAFELHPTMNDILAAIQKEIDYSDYQRDVDSAIGHMNKLFRQAHAVVSAHRGDWFTVGVTGGRPSTAFKGLIQLVSQTVIDNSAAIG